MIARFKKEERYYNLYEQANFFGEISLICHWGRMTSRRGGTENYFL